MWPFRKYHPVGVAVFDCVVTSIFCPGRQTTTQEAVTLLEDKRGRRKAEGDSQVLEFPSMKVWLAGGPMPRNTVEISNVASNSKS